MLDKRLQRGLEHEPPLVVAKSNLKSRVHRRAYMDYVGVRRFGPAGGRRAIGHGIRRLSGWLAGRRRGWWRRPGRQCRAGTTKQYR